MNSTGEWQYVALRSVGRCCVNYEHRDEFQISSKRQRGALSRSTRCTYLVARSVQGNRIPNGRHLSALSAQMTLLNHRFATPWTPGIGLPSVSSVPREGKRARDKFVWTNEVAINFLPAIASFARAFHTGGALYVRRRKTFRQLSVVWFPINDLLGSLSYMARN